MKKTKKASSLIMVIVLLTMWLILWTIIIQKKASINNILEDFGIKSTLSQNISTNDNLIEKHIQNNKPNWNYRDIINCPLDIRYMSWAAIIWTWTTSIFSENENYFCSWSINSNDLKINFNENYNSFTWWILWSSWFILSYNNPNFSGAIDSKIIEFDYDLSNVNLYNYSLWKKEISWKVDNMDYKMIFYINDKVRKIINDNTNNNSNYTKKIQEVFSGSIFLDINWTWSIKIIEFDKTNINKLTKKDIILEWDIPSWSWNIQNLYLDFTNNDFAVFLKSIDNNILDYNLKINDISWSWVFITPIRDDLDYIEFLSQDIIIKNNNFIKEEYLIK